MTAFILFVYLSTSSASGGMTVATAEFSSLGKCQIAEKKVHKEFTGWATKGYTFCTEK